MDIFVTNETNELHRAFIFLAFGVDGHIFMEQSKIFENYFSDGKRIFSSYFLRRYGQKITLPIYYDRAVL